MQTIKVERESFIRKLSSLKEDNVSIADVSINRKTLIEALKLQTQPGTDVINLTYGKLSWDNDGRQVVDNEPCVQFNCNHTVMRFLNRPSVKRGAPSAMQLNFVDYRNATKQELTGIPIDTQELIRAINYVSHAVSKEYARPELACILFETGNDIIRLVTADGFRLAVIELPIKNISNARFLIENTDIAKLITFLKSVKPVGTGKGKYYPEVFYSNNDKSITFASDDRTLTLDKQDYNFPDYERLIPTTGIHIETIASNLLQSVKALSGIAKDGSDIIRLEFKRGYPIGIITLSSKNNDDNVSIAECDARVDSDCKIAVNAKYLKDALTPLKDKVIDIFIRDTSSPFVIHCGSEQYETVMPMYVAGDK